MVARVDHVAAGLARIRAQYRDAGLVKPKMRAILEAILEEVNELEDAILGVIASRMLETATGDALRRLSALVGQPVISTDDEEQRRAVRARIRANRSLGAVEDVIEVTRLVVPEAVELAVSREDHDTVRVVVVTATGLSATVSDLLLTLLRKTVAAHIRILVDAASAADSMFWAPDDAYSSVWGDDWA